MDLLNILGNSKRRELLKILTITSKHVSALAQEIALSVPVTLRHINLMEQAGLVEKNRVGNTTFIDITQEARDILKTIEDIVDKPTVRVVKKGQNLYEALKTVPGVSMKKWPRTKKYFIHSIDNIPGDYIFLMNGEIVGEAVNEVHVAEDATIEFQKVVHTVGKKIKLKLG